MQMLGLFFNQEMVGLV